MCLIIVQMGQQPIDYEDLELMRASNPHGIGVMFSYKKRLVVQKYLNDFSKFYKNYLKIRHTSGTPIVLHFRMATHGNNGIENTHPFFVNPNLAFCHNGIIASMPRDNTKSDTRLFNEIILQKLPPNFCFQEGILKSLELAIRTDKIVFLDNLGRIVFLNERLGHWENDIWYSNSFWKLERFSMDDKNNDNDDIIFDFCQECGDLVSDGEDVCEVCKYSSKLYNRKYACLTRNSMTPSLRDWNEVE